jgi:hypothetical protein
MKTKLLPVVLLVSILFSVLLPSGVAQASPASSSEAALLSGWLTILWGDGIEGSSTAQQFYLNTGDGNLINLILNEELARPFGGVLGLDRRQVTVEGTWAFPAGTGNEQPAFQVASLSMPDLDVGSADISPLVSGSQPWISIMCKFSDVGAEPKNLAYFQGMYGSTWPGLDHYWREVSYNTANVLGSTAVGWYTLPQPRSYYVYNNALDFSRAATDCTGVADSYVNFASFVGINLMFNDDLDGYAWGGGQYMTLDGVTKVWRMTWEPPWGYSAITVMSHEMGHGFGLPHSSGAYGQTYDNRWDVMSDTWTDCGNSSDATYGCIGQHTISYHLDILGWIPAGQKFTAGGGISSITLEQLALPQTTNYKMAQIPIGGSSTHFYTVEARRKTGYDVKLPGEAVIIHEVDTSRGIPAHVIDPDNNGNTGDAAAMWTVGETFSDPANGISVYVSAATATGFQVSITTPSIPPAAFSKSSPTNGATSQSTSPTLTWGASAGATSYEYCYDTTNDNACSSWISTGTTVSANLSGLSSGTAYYWQVRASNPSGTTYADGGSTAFWSFTTTAVAVANDDFNNAITFSVPYANTQSISGATTAGDDPGFACLSNGQRYYTVWYKYTPTVGGTLTVDTNGSNFDTVLGIWAGTRGSLMSVGCDDDSGTDVQSLITVGVSAGTTYYIEAASYYSTLSGNSLVLSASQVNAPVAFNKINPASGTTNQPTSITLSWGASSDAESYEYCFDTTNDNACSSWTSNGTSTGKTLSGLSTSTTYYWQVRANNSGGTTYANGSSTAYWSFTTTSVVSASYFEPFHSDVFASSSWTRTDTSVAVQTSGSMLHVNIDGSNDDAATKTMTFNLPLTFEARMRLVSGGNNYRLPWVTFYYGSSSLGLTYLEGYGWVFKDYTYITTKAPASENVWVTVRVVLRPDGGDLYARYDGDTDFTYVTSRSWSITGPITSIRISQPWDAPFDVDYVAVNFPSTFNDVPGDYWAWQYVESLYKSGITSGCGTSPLIYCPENSVTRAQMAIFLERGMHGSAYTPPAAAGTVFLDVPTSYWAAPWIEKLAADGITSGCGSGNYCPEDPVTRVQMAIFLLRAKHGSGYAPPVATGIFTDVPTSYWAVNWIEQLYAEGITGGCGTGLYCPDNLVTRAQMAVFLVRTFSLP